MLIWKLHQTIEKMFSVLEVNASKYVALNCLYYEENPGHPQSMCQQTILRFSMSPRGTQLFSQWSRKIVKVLSLRLKQCFGPFTTLPVKGCSEMGLFRHLPHLSKSVISEIHKLWRSSFFENVQNLMQIWKIQKKCKKNFFWDKCIWIFTLNCLYQEENTFYPQWLSKQKVLRLCMSLRVTIANSIIFTVINEYGKGAAVEIESVFGAVFHVACRGVVSNRTSKTFI